MAVPGTAATPKVLPAGADSVGARSDSADAGVGQTSASVESVPAPVETSSRILSGHLAGIDDEGRVLFRPEGGESASEPVSEPLPVMIGLALPDGAVVKAARLGHRALVVETADEPKRHVLLSLLRERVHAQARDAEPGQLEVTMDGETLRLSADRQIELKCGQSRLLLRADGKVEISGTYVLSRSRGPNKIKGASIALN